jgi:hypothetical protein
MKSDYFHKVRNLTKTHSWREIFAELPVKYADHDILRQQYHKELYRRAYKKAMQKLAFRGEIVRHLTTLGFSAAGIASMLQLSERTVVRARSAPGFVNLEQLKQLQIAILKNQLVATKPSEALYQLVGLEAHSQELRAWEAAIEATLAMLENLNESAPRDFKGPRK